MKRMTKTEKLVRINLLKKQDFWSEYTAYPVSDWQDEVREGNTRNGYWEWVIAQVEAED